MQRTFLLNTMKQFTTPEQTAKLIELGLPRPKSIAKCNVGTGVWGYRPLCEQIYAYSIGELIEMLPMAIGANYLEIFTPVSDRDVWAIAYGWHDYDEFNSLYYFANEELIDALYEMAVKLKEEGVI